MARLASRGTEKHPARYQKASKGVGYEGDTGRDERVRLIRDGNPPRLPHNRSEEVFWHPAFPSFGVRQTYTGQASWIVQYKLHGRSRKVTVGDVRLLDEMEARKAAKKILAKVELDRLDPQAAKEEARRSAKVTFESVTEQFLAERQDSSRPKHTTR
jgi:hypothetical protein